MIVKEITQQTGQIWADEKLPTDEIKQLYKKKAYKYIRIMTVIEKFTSYYITPFFKNESKNQIINHI